MTQSTNPRYLTAMADPRVREALTLFHEHRADFNRVKVALRPVAGSVDSTVAKRGASGPVTATPSLVGAAAMTPLPVNIASPSATRRDDAISSGDRRPGGRPGRLPA